MLAIGIDISKKKIDIFMKGKLTTLSNDEETIKTYFKTITPNGAKVVMEATGRMHRASHRALASIGFPVMVINPFQSRHFAKSMNVLCKTDKVDAKILCQFAERMEFKTTTLPGQNEELLRDLVRHLDDLKQLLQQTEQRLEDAKGFGLKSLSRLIKSIDEEIKKSEKQIAALIKSDDELSRRSNLLITIPGIGKATAAVILGLLSEIGTIPNRAIAALAGLAPMNFDSGSFEGKRRIQKGRHDLRRLLYMPCLGASTRYNKALVKVYNRLLAAGKEPKVALTACMRKLIIFANAVLKNGTAWHEKTSIAAE